METDNRARLKQWLDSGEVRLQPLTFPQRELWENTPVPVGDPANHICGFIEFKGPLTYEQVQQCIQRVVDRQEAMRISFLPGKDRVLQMIRATGSANVDYRELSAAEAKPEALEELMKETYRAPFDLMQGPLHRVTMMRRGPNDCVLAFSIHHSIADGWSLGVFVQDLCTAYVMSLSGLRRTVAVKVMGMAHALPPVPQTYSEWAAAERAFWQPAELERRAGFWKSELEGSRQLWADSRPAQATFSPLQRWASSIPAPLTRGIRDLVSRSGATLFSTLLAAFQIALSKWTGKDDILVGTPVANRSKVSTHQTMGYFAGNVPLRGRIDRDQTLADRIREVHTTSVECFGNAMPFAELATLVGGGPGNSRHMVYDVRFALQNHPVPDMVVPRVSAKLRMRSTGTPRFDLGCEITEMGAELEVVWLFQPDMFSKSSMAELNEMLLAVLTIVCRSPDSRTSALSV